MAVDEARRELYSQIVRRCAHPGFTLASRGDNSDPNAHPTFAIKKSRRMHYMHCMHCIQRTRQECWFSASPAVRSSASPNLLGATPPAPPARACSFCCCRCSSACPSLTSVSSISTHSPSSSPSADAGALAPAADPPPLAEPVSDVRFAAVDCLDDERAVEAARGAGEVLPSSAKRSDGAEPKEAVGFVLDP